MTWIIRCGDCSTVYHTETDDDVWRCPECDKVSKRPYKRFYMNCSTVATLTDPCLCGRFGGLGNIISKNE